MIDGNFEHISNLQYRLRDLTSQVKAFKSGEKYIVMRSECRAQIAVKEREIKKLKLELADANCQTATVRKYWMQVTEDMESEHAKALQSKDRENESLKRQLLDREIELAATKDKLRDKTSENYETLTDLEDANGTILKLKAQINRDYETSSTPSSSKPNHDKIVNNREKTDRKPGGQPGHKGYGRKKLTPTNIIEIPAPKEFTDNPEYRPTGKTITKQSISIRLDLIVNEYNTQEYRNIRTGQRVHASFPDGAVDDINYGASVKALAFLLNTRYCVSIDKVRELLSELTNGELQISNGMICGLTKSFSAKTLAEQKATFADLLLSPVMNTDFTSARLNGKSAQIITCATPDKVMYFAKEHKGHEGVKGTPVEDYQGILVHDHDITFYSYGGNHQECLTHPLRYLKDSILNEPDLGWNKKMRELIQEMIHYHKCTDVSPEKAKEFETKYKDILSIAKKEYEYVPPSKYYVDGYNLYKRLDEYIDNHLLFLHDNRIPSSNNYAERLLRIFKRKLRQSMTFRSFDSLNYLCIGMGIIETLRAQGVNLFNSVTDIFNN